MRALLGLHYGTGRQPQHTSRSGEVISVGMSVVSRGLPLSKSTRAGRVDERQDWLIVSNKSVDVCETFPTAEQRSPIAWLACERRRLNFRELY